MDQETSNDTILWRVDGRGVAYITLNRPQVYNAYNSEMIAALLAAFIIGGLTKVLSFAMPRERARGVSKRRHAGG